MSTLTLPYPATLRHHLQRSLPRQAGYQAGVRVTPRDRYEGRCAAYAADHYEVQAHYVTGALDSLVFLEEAFAAIPGVYMTTQVHPAGTPAKPDSTFTNPDWPTKLGIKRRDRRRLRPQVIALIRDPRPQQ
jgi:hypothetical protein